MKATFLEYDKPMLTAMIQCTTPEECIAKIEASEADGAEAYGIQLCQIEKKYRTKQILKKIFDACNGKPIYITSYRYGASSDYSDEQCAELLLMGLEAGATLCDVMGDMFCKDKNELTFDELAIKKQKALIDEIHRLGGEVLMSSHTFMSNPDAKNLSPEETVEMALAQAERGADIIKIVNRTDTIEELPECIRTIECLKKVTNKKFLYLVAGPCHKVVRQIGPNLGVCMYLCVQKHGTLDTPEQPVLKNLKAVRDNIVF